MNWKARFVAAVCVSLALCFAALVVAGCGSDPPLVAAPTNFAATPQSATTVQLSWDVNSTNEDGFRIYRDDGPSTPFQEIGTVGTGGTSYDDDTATFDTFYTYYVVGFVGTSESSANSGETVVQAGAFVTAPTSLVAQPQSDTEVSLTWVPQSSNEDGFYVYRDDGPSTPFQLIATKGAGWMGHLDSTVVAGTFYTYYVVGFIGADESAAHSNEATVEAVAPYVDVLTPTDSQMLTLGDFIDIEWTTNMPNFDAKIELSLNASDALPDYDIPLQLSWAPNGSPWTWKVGYKNTEEDPTESPIWEQVVFSDEVDCGILIWDYSGVPASGYSDGTFTIIVP